MAWHLNVGPAWLMENKIQAGLPTQLQSLHLLPAAQMSKNDMGQLGVLFLAWKWSLDLTIRPMSRQDSAGQLKIPGHAAELPLFPWNI